MKKSRSAALSRAHLDERLKDLGPVAGYTPPVKGWIRAIREALGMTAEQLARRLGVKQPSVIQMEQSEAKGSIELGTLRRVADALDCTLVYAFVPKKPLEETVRARARNFIRRRQAPVEHSMLLEDQKVQGKAEEARLEEALRDTSPSRFWE
ncbi:MAG: mobile mystery protein A [Acidobacteriia bacterium]|nr:mobile mystery protein A [Terriglobia bacterium]